MQVFPRKFVIDKFLISTREPTALGGGSIWVTRTRQQLCIPSQCPRPNPEHHADPGPLCAFALWDPVFVCELRRMAHAQQAARFQVNRDGPAIAGHGAYQHPPRCAQRHQRDRMAGL